MLKTVSEISLVGVSVSQGYLCIFFKAFRSCREEIRKAKAQLELRMATVVRDNKKCLYKYISNKKRAKENLHTLLDAKGNIVNKG